MNNIGLVNKALSVVMRETCPQELQDARKIIAQQLAKIQKLEKRMESIDYDPSYICDICDKFSSNGHGMFECRECRRNQHYNCCDQDELLRDICSICKRYWKECQHGEYSKVDICSTCAWNYYVESSAEADSSADSSGEQE